MPRIAAPAHVPRAIQHFLGAHPVIFETLREGKFGKERKGWIDAWEADPNTLDTKKFLSLIEAIGKGRFAQRLASRMGGLEPPAYIRNAIEFVVDRV